MSRRPEHRRETARFWRENRAEAALRERFLVPAEEYERFARALEQALAAHRRREEERIRQVPRPGPARQRPASQRPASPPPSPQMAAGIREAERRQRETVQAALQVGETYPALGPGPPDPREGMGGGSAQCQKYPSFFLTRSQLQTETELCAGPSAGSPPAAPGR